MDPLDSIARGGEAAWQQTFTHPKHGEITFVVPQTLRNRDWLRQANALDRIVRELGGDPNDASARTTLFANACAGISELMECPVIDERRSEQDDGSERVEAIRYDPLEDEDMGFPMEVWGSFFAWRTELLGRVAELGKDSGETRSSVSGEQLLAVTGSPSTIPV